LPRWEGYFPVVGDKGFLTVDEIVAGDEYVDRSTGEIKEYLYSGIYFEKFIKQTEDIEIYV